ncbi:MAG: STAS domain-containing protein [Methylococcales bacterium]
MATNNKHNLIGYDPLAWMGEPDVDDSNAIVEAEDTEHAESGVLPAIEESDALTAEDEAILELDEPLDSASAMPDDLIDDTETLDVEAIDSMEEGSDTFDDDASTDNEILAALGDDMAMSGEVEMENGGFEEVVSTEADAVSAESVIHLETNLSIQHIVKLHEKLKASLSAFEQIEVNAADVASIDTASLQLLVSLKKEADKLNKQVDFNAASPRFIESAKLLGLAEVLNVAL